MWSFLLDGLDQKGRDQLVSTLEQRVFEWEFDQDQERTAEDPLSAPTWFTSEVDMAAEALEFRRQFQVLQGGMAEE